MVRGKGESTIQPMDEIGYIYINGINKTNFRVNTDKENIEVG
jgi:hypothetical protein